jgi:hypothetical protein
VEKTDEKAKKRLRTYKPPTLNDSYIATFMFSSFSATMRAATKMLKLRWYLATTTYFASTTLGSCFWVIEPVHNQEDEDEP